MTEPAAEASTRPATARQPKNGLDKYFHITERRTTVGAEIRAGVVTFFAMAYIILLNPLILGTSADSEGTVLGVPQVAAVTAFAAGVMTILFGVVAKYPFGIAAGLGLNTLVAVTLVGGHGLTWPEAMGLVVIEGIIIVLLAVSGFRTAVFRAIPQSMKAAMSVGIGVFIAIIGFVDGGFVSRVPDAANTTVPVGLGIDGYSDVSGTFVRRFAAERPDCDYATHSGPMLVIGGALHPRFLPDSSSRNIRNGVGVREDGPVVLAISTDGAAPMLGQAD